MKKAYLLLTFISFGLQSGFCQKEKPVQKQKIEALETKVSIVVEATSIEEVLLYLEENYDFSFSYINTEIPLKRKTSVNAQTLPLKDVLAVIFKNTLIDYLGYENQVVLVKKDDIEFLEEVKETTNTTRFYLPSISEYDASTKEKGNFVELDKLLHTLIAFYQTHIDPKPKSEAIRDTILIDSLAIRTKDSLILGKKRKKIKLPKLSLRDIAITYGFSLGASSNFWTFATNREQRDFNENSVPDIDFYLGAGIYFEAKHAIVSVDLQYSYLQKNGTHTDFLINTVDAQGKILTRKTGYNEKYHFISTPIKVGFKIPGNRVSYLVQPGITFHRLISSNVANNYRIYQDQYFTNLNLNSSSNPGLSPYFDQNFIPIEPKNTQIRKWNTSVSFSFKIVTKLNDTWKLIMGPEIQYHLLSLYDNNAPLTQNRIQGGIGIIFSPVFPFM